MGRISGFLCTVEKAQEYRGGSSQGQEQLRIISLITHPLILE